MFAETLRRQKKDCMELQSELCKLKQQNKKLQMELSIESRQTSLALDAQENLSQQNEELVKKMKELKKLEIKIM